jgi:hypothetical protein
VKKCYSLTLQRYISNFLQYSEFSFPVREISPVIFNLDPFNKIDEICNVESFHRQYGAEKQPKLR